MSVVCEAIEVDRLIIYPQHHSQNARQDIMDELAQAQKSIQMSAYQMKDQGVADALVSCAQKGINVSLILEEDPYKHGFNRGSGSEQ